MNNNFKIKFDKTYKVKDYYYKNTGKIINTSLVYKKPMKTIFLQEDINKLDFKDSKIETILSSKKYF